MTHQPEPRTPGVAPTDPRTEERLAWLAQTQESLARTIRRAPRLALSALVAIPVGLLWGKFAAVAVAGFGLFLPVVITYLSWCHQEEYTAEEATLREKLAASTRTSPAPRGRPWRVPGKRAHL